MTELSSNLSIQEEEIYSKWSEQAEIFLEAKSQREKRELIEQKISNRFRVGKNFLYISVMVFSLLQIFFGVLLLLCQFPEMNWLRSIVFNIF